MLEDVLFGVSMLWREQKTILMTATSACWTKKVLIVTKNTWNYPSLESALRPVPHCEEVPLLEFNDLLDLSME